MRRPLTFAAIVLLAEMMAGASAFGDTDLLAVKAKRVDTALVLAVDVSSSVDGNRYRLQLEGIAQALADPDVQNAILRGGDAPLLITLVTWADRATISLPWTILTTPEDATAFAARIRGLPREGGNFTCVAKMFNFVADKVLPTMPVPARHIVVDVSGDGSENCNPREPTTSARDDLVGEGATINGLPIREGREALTIAEWYATNVIGGPGAFAIAADSFADVGRAMRQKFLTEVSSLYLSLPESGANNYRDAPRVTAAPVCGARSRRLASPE
jgi:hypothetical protein